MRVCGKPQRLCSLHLDLGVTRVWRFAHVQNKSGNNRSTENNERSQPDTEGSSTWQIQNSCDDSEPRLGMGEGRRNASRGSGHGAREFHPPGGIWEAEKREATLGEEHKNTPR